MSFDDVLDERMKLFDKFLSYCGLDKKKYQEDGVRWCLKNEICDKPLFNVRGGFIADEMGLGKTIMMIGTFFANFLPRTLIVVPPVLMQQWANEILRTTGHTAFIYHGIKKKGITIDILREFPIVITTYGQICFDEKNEKSILHDIYWSRIVFDEAHHLRNKDTLCHISISNLKGRIRWLVSGTPVQNCKQDFYALCSIIKLPADFYTKSENLVLLARSFILKRTKKQVGIILPELAVHKNVIKWKSEKEKDISEIIHSSLDFPNFPYQFEKEICKKYILPMIISARQSCIYPKLIKNNLKLLVKIGIIDEQNKEIFKQGILNSSKLDQVVEYILERKNNGNGKLIFCHFRDEIDEIATRLIDRGMVNVGTFDGRTHDREHILNFNFEVLILQIQTGCEGINLQKNYNEIYFVSPHWNPAVEDQAIARCHRIGQTKEVFVTRFVMGDFNRGKNNIEKYVDNVQDCKRLIANQCIHEPLENG